MAFGPVVRVGLVPALPGRNAARTAASVPLITGSSLDETKLFTLMYPAPRELRHDELVERIEPMFGGRTARVIETYQARPCETPADVWDAVLTYRQHDLPGSPGRGTLEAFRIRPTAGRVAGRPRGDLNLPVLLVPP